MRPDTKIEMNRRNSKIKTGTHYKYLDTGIAHCFYCKGNIGELKGDYLKQPQYLMRVTDATSKHTLFSTHLLLEVSICPECYKKELEPKVKDYQEFSRSLSLLKYNYNTNEYEHIEKEGKN